MAGRPRLPQAVAKASGAALKNPKRFKGRSSPKVAELGPAPAHMDELQRQNWDLFAAEMPWLAASDRTLVEVASVLRAAMSEGALPTSALSELRQCLTAMGATPAARSRITSPKDDDDSEDPAAEFLN